jgi:hypothetical protein
LKIDVQLRQVENSIYEVLQYCTHADKEIVDRSRAIELSAQTLKMKTVVDLRFVYRLVYTTTRRQLLYI